MDDLEKRSESIEWQALASLHAHCPAACKAAIGASLDEVGGALVASASQDGSILINRTLGLGVQRVASAQDVEAIVAHYRERGIGKYFLHVYPHRLEPGLHARLPDLGLKRVRGWQKFRRGNAAPPEANTILRVERVTGERAMDFGRIVAPAFGMKDESAPLLAGLGQDPRWHLFVSYDGDTAAGAGALMIEGDSAWTEWGATAPEFRKRGSQGAIMAARVRAAIEAGCAHIFTETGEAVAGDPQHSYRNIERYGFVAAELRENWAPA